MGVEEQVGEFAKASLKRHWTFFGVSGLMLVIIAIMDGFPKWLLELSPQWRLLCFLLGLTLIAACFIVSWHELRLEPSSPKITASDYGFMIQRPDNGESVSLPISFTGTLKRPLPEGVELWLCTFASESPPKFWPQVKAETSGKTWSCNVNDEWMFRNGRADYRFLLVGRNGQVVQRLYFHLNNLHRERTRKWLSPLSELPDDTVPCSPARQLIWRDYRPSAS